MSVSYSSIGWNRQKKIYDLTILVLMGAIFFGFGISAFAFHPEITAETFLLRSLAISAILLLHLVLAVGPLARIDSRFLPLLFNRRHLGVGIFLLGLTHAILSVFQFHALGNIPARVSVLSSYFSDFAFWQKGGELGQIPFEPFGLIALGILLIMAATSHDFWLKYLGAHRWKKIHILVYGAYASLVIHISYGFLQSERHPLFVALLALGIIALVSLHGIAYWVDRQKALHAGPRGPQGFHPVCKISDLKEGQGRVVDLDGRRIAIFLNGGLVHALSNTCRHQGGPIGEGRIVDGCITCPWHGWQYQPKDGCSPPPFREVLPTFATHIEGDQVFVHPQERIAILPLAPVHP